MSHNPYNAVTVLGHAHGCVSMWTPTSREPVVKMLCHKGPIRAVAIDKRGLWENHKILNFCKIILLLLIGQGELYYLYIGKISNLS